MSTKTGYAVITDGNLVASGLVTRNERSLDGTTQICVEDYGFLQDAKDIALKVSLVINKEQPDFIYIEQTNLGMNRTSQKQLEFIHCMVLFTIKLCVPEDTVRYVDTSGWRKSLSIRMSKEDSKHNRLVKQKIAKGKITTKHLAVRWANDKFNLELLLKDNDIADAIAVAMHGFNYENKSWPSITEKDIEDLFNKS